MLLALIGALVTGGPPRTIGYGDGSAAIFKPNLRGTALAKLLVLEDLQGYFAGKKVVGDWANFDQLGERITANELHRLYNYNEVAADERFKGKPVVVAGTIMKISKDIFGSTYLVLGAGNMFASVQAALAKESAAGAGSLAPGMAIALACHGAGMILTSPILKDCQANEIVLSLHRAAIEQKVDDLFGGEKVEVSDGIKRVVGVGYAAGTILPRGNTCETVDLPDLTPCTDIVRKISRKEIATAYGELAKQMALPPLPGS